MERNLLFCDKIFAAGNLKQSAGGSGSYSTWHLIELKTILVDHELPAKHMTKKMYKDDPSRHIRIEHSHDNKPDSIRSVKHMSNLLKQSAKSFTVLEEASGERLFGGSFSLCLAGAAAT